MHGRGVIVTLLTAILGSTAYQVNSVSGKSKTVGTPPAPRPVPAAAKGPESALLRTFTDFDKGGVFQSPFRRVAGRNRVHNKFGQEYRWLIATVPDPDNSNMRLDFDREIAAIQLAADSAGYQYDRYWFPWGVEETTKSSEGTAETSKGSSESTKPNNQSIERKDLPGVLLFRGPQKNSNETSPALAIFLVGETPTAGIQPQQFRNAVCFASSLQSGESDSKTLRILGPSFSGSFPSLAKLTGDSAGCFRQASDQKAEPMFEEIFIRSWTSDAESQKTFERTLIGRRQTVHLRTTETSSVASINRFVSYLRGEWHENGPIMLLVEEGTGFATGIRNAVEGKDRRKSNENTGNSSRELNLFQCLQDSRIFMLTFPRNISNLRNATENNDHLPGFGDDSKRQDMPRNGLLLSLKDDKTGSSEMPMFSKQQTPVSQESVLFSIGSLLKTDTVHYVGIVASNPLDMLFLTRYLKSAAPNLRQFTLDSDLMLEHGSDSADYEGVLAVTNYPLFAISQLWTGSQGTLHVFPSSTSESIHNALTSLLAPWVKEEKTISALRDLKNPFEPDFEKAHPPSNAHPPLWITVASRTGFEPIAVLPDPRDPYDRPQPQNNDYLVDENLSGFRKLVPEYWPSWEYVFCFIVCLAAGYGCLLVSASPNGKRNLAIFSAKPDEPNAFPRAFYLCAIGMCFCTLVAAWLVVPGEILYENLLRNLDPNGPPTVSDAFVKVMVPVAASLMCSAAVLVVYCALFYRNGRTLRTKTPLRLDTGVLPGAKQDLSTFC